MQAIPINGETWLICGGRDFAGGPLFWNAMSDLLGMYGCPALIVHGAARGADTIAANWARRMAVNAVAMPADWRSHGKAAGPIRNQAMLDRYRPHRVVAFPGGRGTADMKDRARKAGIDVLEIVTTEPDDD